MINLKDQKSILRVFFHVGVALGPMVETGAQAGLKNVKSVDFAALDAIAGVLVRSTIGGKDYEDFVPLTNITGIRLQDAPTSAPKAASKAKISTEAA